ncbi:ATAD2B (predicted), partial [Pycnogonum litorale]
HTDKGSHSLRTENERIKSKEKMVRTRHAGCEQGVLFHQDITQNSKMKRDVVSDSDSASTEVVMNYKRRRGDLNSISNPKVDQVQPSPLHTRSRGLHLVLSDTDSDDEVKTYTSRSGRRIIHNKLFGDYDSRYYRKTRHSLRNHTPCVPQEQNESPEIIDDDDDDDAPLAKSTLNSKQARQPSSRSNSRRVTDGVHGKTSPDVPMMNGNISYLDDDSSIRRSTRQRKVVYDTLNQSWLLGTTTSGAAFRSENIACSSKPNYDDNEETSNVDMYSRVKQRHTKTGTLFQEKKESSSTDNEAETITEEQSSSEDNDNSNHSKYHLRPKKPLTNRFQISIDSRPRRLTSSSMFNHPPSSRSFSRTYHSPVHHSPMFKNRRHAAHNNSSTSSSSDDEMRFERRKSKSMARSRGRFLPMNLKNEDLAMGVIRDRVKIGSSLADVDPMEIDKTVTFEKVGGLAHHLNSLKEMILFPLLYPEVFEKFKISPPRGVLFYGPPGTGKTLVARALANECSQSDRKIAFFMRKGADCLSKWVGESERQLRLLFDQAYSMRPSIIFFDEIDGLAPVRSSRQDQIHSSIVSTLLALMDGLDNRGEVVIIGATNRIDTVDPALRRPGRFDREFNFPLPSLKARESIMEIHTKDWKPPLTSSFVSEIARKCVGYCGADVKALCAEATLIALRRRYPQIYSSKQKLVLDVSSI